MVRMGFSTVDGVYSNIDIKSILSVYFNNWISEQELINKNEK